MGKALVTGATGFIGGHLVPALRAAGWGVRCLARNPANAVHLAGEGVEIVAGDITDEESVRRATRGVDAVFHLAGVTHTLRVEDFWRANRLGTRHVAEACARQETPPVLIHVSSIAASGPVRKGEVRDESQTPVPVSHYGRSKLAGELEVARNAEHVPTTVLRPGIVFGPHNRECFPIFQAIQRTGVHATPGWGFPPLSYIAISDLISLTLAAARRAPRLEPGRDGENLLGRGCYFATCAEYPSYAEFGRLVGGALGRAITCVLPIAMPIMVAAAATAELAGRLCGFCPLVNLDKMREAKASSWACSSARAAADLGFRPAASLATHLQTTVSWYREAGWLPAARSARPASPRAAEGSRVAGMAGQ